MANNNERTSSTSLYNELKKLAKRANQRIVRLEKLTGETGTFATKQLYDYLDNEVIQALTSKGRISVRRDYDNTQMTAIIKAINLFLQSDSTVKEVKKLKSQYEKESGKKLNYKQAHTYFQAEKNYKWIYQFIPQSEFWEDIGVPALNWSLNEFTEKIKGFIEEDLIDENMERDIINLYNYVRGE